MAKFEPVITYKITDDCSKVLKRAIKAASDFSLALEELKELDIELELEDK